MIKTPLSTMIGGAFWTPGCTIIGGNTQSFSQLIKNLFANNEQGFAYDPNDLTTMYQDAAGTVPVTAVGQAVGLVLDKSKGLGLGASRFTIEYVDFTNSWTSTASVISKTKYSFTTNGGGGCYMGVANVLGKTVKLRVKGHCTVPFFVRNGDDMNGSITVPAGSFDIVSNNPVIFYTGSSIYFNLTGAGTLTLELININDLAGNHAHQTTSSMRPILRQHAVTGANYLEFDGSDDFLVTNSVDFTGTDKVSLFAGVRKLSDANTGIVCELSTRAGATTNLGAFVMYAPFDPVQTGYGFRSIGTLESTSFGALPLAPNSSVLAAKSSISLDILSLRVNAAQYSTWSQDQGAGNYGNYPLYIGRRAGTALPFNGHIYGLIGVGKLTSDNETTAIEKELAKRLGVTLNV